MGLSCWRLERRGCSWRCRRVRECCYARHSLPLWSTWRDTTRLVPQRRVPGLFVQRRVFGTYIRRHHLRTDCVTNWRAYNSTDRVSQCCTNDGALSWSHQSANGSTYC